MEVTIYSTSSCSACHSLKQWLDSKSVSYKSVVVDESPEGMQSFLAVSDGMIGVPFTVIEDGPTVKAKISGFDQGKFKQALNI